MEYKHTPPKLLSGKEPITYGGKAINAAIMDNGLKDDSRLIRYRITQEQRQTFYQEAVQRQNH